MSFKLYCITNHIRTEMKYQEVKHALVRATDKSILLQWSPNKNDILERKGITTQKNIKYNRKKKSFFQNLQQVKLTQQRYYCKKWVYYIYVFILFTCNIQSKGLSVYCSSKTAIVFCVIWSGWKANKTAKRTKRQLLCEKLSQQWGSKNPISSSRNIFSNYPPQEHGQSIFF